MALVMVDPKPQIRPIGINAQARINIEEIDWCVDTALTKDMEIYLIL